MYKPVKKQIEVLGKLKNLDPNFEIKWDQKTGAPLRLKGALSRTKHSDPEKAAIEFLQEIKDLLLIKNANKEFILKRINIDSIGAKHVRLQQYYKDLPVFCSELVVHIDANSVIRGITGRLSPELDLPDKPTVSAEQALDIVLKDDNNNFIGPLYKNPTLMILSHFIEKPCLVWHMEIDGTDLDLFGEKIIAKWQYFVDALNGKIVWKYNNVQSNTATLGSGVGLYAGSVTINTLLDHSTGKYLLEDHTLPTSSRILTRDAKNGLPPAAVSEDDDNDWSDEEQGPDVDCHLFTRMVFDYFYETHGRNSYDDGGADMNIYCHVRQNWNNATWNGSYVQIGNGDGVRFNPLCTLDIIAHEWTHGVTQYSAGLIYYGQSGALNESMSDVFAALISGSWLIGEDAWLSATAPALRNMEDPTNGGQYNPNEPIQSVINGHQPDHTDDMYTGSQNNGGVHINCGIMNKAAQLIATGGIHRDIRICEGLGRALMGEIYYHALTTYLVGTSDFSDMRDAVLDSLDHLYADNVRFPRWRASIINAFAAVGIGDAVRCPIIFSCPSLPQLKCPPAPSISCPSLPQLKCPPAPNLCMPSPMIKCPPAPNLSCPPSPTISCLPGPDPVPPFRPIIRDKSVFSQKTHICQVSGITDKNLAILNTMGITTVGEFLKMSENEEKVGELSKKSKISVSQIKKLRREILELLQEIK